MNRYADLRKNRVSRLEGNLVVSKQRKPSKGILREPRSYPLGSWIFILVMFLVSGLYIRYQTLYVEDSIFRDAYLLIDEHFLSKEIIPLPVKTEETVVPPPIPEASPVAAQAVQNPPVNPTVPNIPPAPTAENIEEQASLEKVVAKPDAAEIKPVENTAPAPVASEIKEPGIIPAQISGVFSHYYPILNSKSTKVGFFVVDQKTETSEDKFYSTLFQNLITFKSSNPKVRNFFDPRTRLKQAWVENDTLLLDFNSAFENSKYGYMGMEVKIQQILWTFFNYREDKINKILYISFLIDGKRKDIVGGDGKILKPFYSRKDLNSVVAL